MELRAKTIKYSKQKRSGLRNKEKILQNEVQELDHKFVITILLIRRSWKNMKLLKKNSNIYMK